MIKLERTEVVGWEHAIRGMRNPLNSWDMSDSYKGCSIGNCNEDCSDWHQCCGLNSEIIVGEKDLGLMKRLRNAGTDHRKFMRMLTVYVDITAPLYWWKEFDTYKVGTVANSCSTMHKIHDKEFELDDFSHEHLGEFVVINGTELNVALDCLMQTIKVLNTARMWFLATKDKKYWWHMIQILPSSYNQKRTVMLNYEVLANMYKSRKNHKLDEWRDLCRWIESLPYSELIIGGDN